MNEFELVPAPEPVRNGGGNTNPLYARFAAFLREHPGQWALWPDENRIAADVRSEINRGRYASLSEGFTAAVRAGQCLVCFTGTTQPQGLEGRLRALIREELRAGFSGLDAVCVSARTIPRPSTPPAIEGSTPDPDRATAVGFGASPHI